MTRRSVKRPAFRVRREFLDTPWDAEAFITVYAGGRKCETGAGEGGFFREIMDKLEALCYDETINLNWRGMRR